VSDRGSHPKTILALALAALAALASRCGPPTIAPVSAPDPGAPCPGGKTAWSLEVLDRRVDREASDRVVALLRDSIVKSFPACTWSAAADPGLPSVSIEINRFRAPFGDGMWNGVADWNILARDPAGRTLTEFDAVSEVARPNYQGSNNEKEAMTQVYREALEKTLAGLRAVPPIQ
jgi:hypothetical protein